MSTIKRMFFALVAITVFAFPMFAKADCTTTKTQFATDPFKMTIQELVVFEKCAGAGMREAMRSNRMTAPAIASTGGQDFNHCISLAQRDVSNAPLLFAEYDEVRQCASNLREMRISEEHAKQQERLYGVHNQ